jgi:hypothetical protein
MRGRGLRRFGMPNGIGARGARGIFFMGIAREGVRPIFAPAGGVGAGRDRARFIVAARFIIARTLLAISHSSVALELMIGRRRCAKEAPGRSW